ncbi:MAG: hypothetical protein NT159_06415 [Proteobacteria bacterium]|nr:hypothetical protein [Pseudomonadota bacterium]
MADDRNSPRCSVHWRGAVVLDDYGKQETIQFKTNDISISGVSVVCHRNIPAGRAVTVYLLIDPGNHYRPQVIVEATGSTMNSVFSNQQGGFRVGIQFAKFARDGKQLLQVNLPNDFVLSGKRVAAADGAPTKEVALVADVRTGQQMAPTIQQ